MRRQDPIGTRLQSVRAERGLSLEDVAASVLLSPSQIRGLEHGDVKAFYSPHFYNQGLRKYAALLGVPEALLGDAVVASDAAHAAHPSAAAKAPSATEAVDGRWGGRITAVVVVLAIAAASAAGAWWWRTQETARVAAEPVPPPPAPEAPPVTQAPTLTPILEPAADVAATDPAEAALPEPAVATTGTPAAVPAAAAPDTPGGPYGTVRAGSGTWVFVRYADGTTAQRTLDAGFTFTIAPRPIYLVVGATDVVLTVGGRRIDVTPWVTDGEVRINGRAFAAPPLAAASASSPAP